jgi:hypothetical protein
MYRYKTKAKVPRNNKQAKNKNEKQVTQRGGTNGRREGKRKKQRR